MGEWRRGRLLLVWGVFVSSALTELPLLSANLRRLAGVRSQFARRGAQRLTILVQINTAQGLDAYSKPFAPLAVSTLRRGRRPPPMVHTGRSLDETRFTPLSGAGIAMVIGGAYKYHLKRSGSRPSRAVAPERAGMPAKWTQTLNEVETSVVRIACPELLRGSQ